MIRVDFPEDVDTISAEGLWQYDYGQVLEIGGLNLPSVCLVDFSIIEKDGEAIRVEAVTDSDSITRALIPDSLLAYNENEGMDYKIYAFIYVTDEESGETVRKIKMKVKSRPRRGSEEDEIIDKPLFDELIEKMKGYTDVAIESKDIAVESKNVAIEVAQSVADDKQSIEASKLEVESLREQTVEHENNASDHAETAKQYAETAKNQKESASEFAIKSENEYEKAREEAEKSDKSATRAENALNTLISGIENGDFKGEQGDQGKDGKTPVKGIDYFTTSDKREIAEQVKTDIQPKLDTIEALAKGANLAKVFDTLSEARNWIVTNGSSVNIGTAFYIRETDVSDYWWDGTQLLPLETQKVVLDGYAKLTDIPKKLSGFDDDSGHRTVTDAEKEAWNAKSNFSGSYNDLTDKPEIPNALTEKDIANMGFTKNTGNYTKPSTGIPETDLSAEVKIKLNNVGSGTVKSVNNVQPDENGNVIVYMVLA